MNSKVVRPALTPGLKKLMYAMALPLALLGANSVYLAAISFLGYWRDTSYENPFYLWMFLLHLVLGFALVVPFVVFAALHVRNTHTRRNLRVKRSGYVLLAACAGVIVSGVVMTLRVLPLDSLGGRVSYWLHVLLPVLAIMLYVMHRAFGPRIKWRWGLVYASGVAIFTIGMAAFHSTDPRTWNVRGGGEEYFHPAESRTANLGWIPENRLMMDHYCLECHEDAARDHGDSVHKFSSFNNPVYLFSVRESRDKLLARDGDVRGARFCAGCHDPVPLFSGAFDDPDYDIDNHPTAKAGITCTVCHAITDVAGTVGNGNYTIEEPLHYPLTDSKNSMLSWVNRQLVKAKPAFHKKTFLKPLHKTAEFCAACHKVHIPFELNKYKEFLRGQNHYDNFLLSGVSGHGARSFYYPPQAQPNCNECHMPQYESEDFAAKDGKVHSHRFPGANTAIPHLMGLEEQTRIQVDFLTDGQMDLDLFGLREGGTIDGELIAPLRPELPRLEPGGRYLVEAVLRTMKLGHVFPQGTSDSNEIWVSMEARLNGELIGVSGARNETGHVDPWAHFVNSLILDRDGGRIDRRNVQDIFTVLYTKMMPPGAGQVVHYLLELPPGESGELEIHARLLYRKFDQGIMDYVYDDRRARGQHEGPTPEIPIVTMAEDRITLRVGAGADVEASSSPKKPDWQRWRDYGIGLLLQGNQGSQKGELRQAEVIFQRVAAMGRPEAEVDLARVYEKEGRIDDTRAALRRAVEAGVPTPWTVNWLTGLIEAQTGDFVRAIESFDRVLSTRIPDRGFDFSKDYEVIFEKAKAELSEARRHSGDERNRWLVECKNSLEAILVLDAEHVGAHYHLMLVYRLLDEREA
ncbi:MAG: hypothetical protein KDB53_01975, partial [Planctomycetes bacterium]|nr:hypothetical protein [Planctomycetota bacterium]